MNDPVSGINIVPVKPNRGLIGFASLVYANALYFGHIGVHSRPTGGIRLVYPTINGVSAFHPINKEMGEALEAAVEQEYTRLFR